MGEVPGLVHAHLICSYSFVVLLAPNYTYKAKYLAL